ncbi:MAG: DEAD/DEAH box helicase family protein [Sphaerospermopsis sp.]|nr:DEAD/DEAH box helicase family protein [Sphaerospermopsis sp.]
MRQPLQDSLEIVADLTSKLSFTKEVDLSEELSIVSQHYPSCSDFERTFPSICFSIATGVGKTRLMGACISYLYLEKGVRNFFVLAPNLTIYEKLIEDFGNPSNPKYVFNGIAEFVHNRPVIITGDNYDSLGGLFSDSEIRINVFNISKFNKDASNPRGKEKGQLPRIKRLAEYLGQSYWDYLSNLDDLVILMDEAHRYKADSSAAAINDLKPVFGIELTATPLDERGNAFKNIVYEYNLAQALADGKFVKNPAIAYRNDFQAQGKTEEDIERIKLEDAIALHEDVKTELEVFTNTTGYKKVKPFILVVCKDIAHARDTLSYIRSNAFFSGHYAEKVIQIDSSINDEQNAKLLETVEQYDNPVEIVIHVNMLAEGWDVTNLYTICPLRKADSIKLIEQTIGRGLRLPFKGERVGVDKIDRLTVIAHDNFQKVIDAAQDPNSILQRFSFVELNNDNTLEKTEAVVSVSTIEVAQQAEQEIVNQIVEPAKRVVAQRVVDAKRAIIEALPTLGKIEGVTKVEDLKKPDVKEQVIKQITNALNTGQGNIFAESIVQEAVAQYETVVTQYKENIIEIPRIDLVQDEIETYFEDFDLDTSVGFDLRVLREEIRVRGLIDSKVSIIGVRHGAHFKETPVNQIISELINYPELDYDQCPDLLNKLVSQAVAKLSEGVTDSKELHTLIRQTRKIVAHRIWEQMKRHFKQSEPKYSKPEVLPFTKIEAWSFSALAKDGYKDFRDNIPVRDATKYVYMGFNKSCHPQYKFDSSSEKLLAQIIEEDQSITKWMRPADKQFRIYWANNSRLYYPDFVVERIDAIYLVEVKAANQVDTGEVQDKKRAAMNYCKYASEYNIANGKKPWKYVIFPHDRIALNVSFDSLLNNSE